MRKLLLGTAAAIGLFSTSVFADTTINGFPITFSTGLSVSSSTIITLSTMTANTLKANFTNSTAAPSDFTMPSCPDSSGNHLNYVNGTGITCGTSINIPNSTVTNAMFANMAANTVKSNFTSGSAAPTDFSMPSCPDTSGNHLNYVSGTGISCGTSAGTAAYTTVSKTGNYSVQTSDSGTYFDNKGASGEVDFTLPAESDGLHFCFAVYATQVVKVVAPALTQIAVGITNSTSAGEVDSNTPFSVVCLYAPKGATTQWVAERVVGTWNVN